MSTERTKEFELGQKLGCSSIHNRVCYKQAGLTVLRHISDFYFLIPIDKDTVGVIYTLNRFAACIWELIDGKRSIDDIQDSILRDYDVNLSELGNDITDFLNQLELAGLVNPLCQHNG